MKTTITTDNFKKTINYRVIHPFLSQFISTPFEHFSPKLWAKKTIMFHIGRSGSTVLGNLLNQTEEIFWDSEIYEPFLRYVKQIKKQDSNLETINFPVEPLKVLPNQMILGKMLHPNKTIFGFEAKFWHLRRINLTIQDYLKYLEFLGFKNFIILERKNYLRKVVSSLISNKKLQKFHVTSETQAQLNQIQIDVDNLQTDGEKKPLLKFLQDYQNDFQNLQNLLCHHQVLKLTYEEDISENPQIAVKRVCEFLDTPYKKGKIQHGKTNPFPLKEIIVNYNEVKENLEGTPFEWMIDN